MLWVDVAASREADLLLCERVQQKAPMVPMRTMRATKAPTAMPMITATGSDSAETATRRERERERVSFNRDTLQTSLNAHERQSGRTPPSHPHMRLLFRETHIAAFFPPLTNGDIIIVVQAQGHAAIGKRCRTKDARKLQTKTKTIPFVPLYHQPYFHLLLLM